MTPKRVDLSKKKIPKIKDQKNKYGRFNPDSVLPYLQEQIELKHILSGTELEKTIIPKLNLGKVILETDLAKIISECEKFINKIISPDFKLVDKEINIEDLKTDELSLMRVNVIIGNNNNIYFVRSSDNNTLLYNVFSSLENILEHNQEKYKYPDFEKLFKQKLIDKSGQSDESITEYTTSIILPSNNRLTKLIELCKMICQILNINIVLLVSPRFIGDNDPIILASDKDSLDNTRDTVILHLEKYLNKREIIIKPLVGVNVDTREITTIISKESIGTIDYLNKLIIANNKHSSNPIITDIDTSSTNIVQERKIEFNPYDKDVELPIIKIHSSTKGEIDCLLGNEYDGFYNIYKIDANNDLVGKIKIISDETDNTTIDVYWCE